MNEIFKLSAIIQTNAKVATAEIQGFEKAGQTTGSRLGATFEKLGKILKIVLVAAAAAASYALGKFFISSIKSAAEFEQQMAMVQSVTNATAEEFDALGEKAKDLGKLTKFTMIEIGEGMESLGRAGLTANEIIDSMAGVCDLASSQMIGLGIAGEMVSGALKGFNLAASESTRVADIYAYSASKSAISTEDFAETLKYAMPAANALGLEIEDVAGMAMLLGDNMVKGSMAGTSLSFAFSQLIQMGDDFTGKLKEMGVSVADISGPDGELLGMAEIIGVLKAKGLDAGDMFALFGERAGKGMAILLEKGEDALREYTESLEDCGGTAQRMAEIQLNTLSGQVTILKGSWELLKVTIGEKLIPILKDFVKDTLIPLVNRLVDWARENDALEKGFRSFIEGVKSGFNWIIDNRHTLVIAIKAIGAAFAVFLIVTNPILALSAALAGLGIVLATSGKKVATAEEACTAFDESLDCLVGAVHTASSALTGLNRFVESCSMLLGTAIEKMVEAGTVGADAFDSITVELSELRDQMKTLKPEEIADAWVLGVDAILSKYTDLYPELEALRVSHLSRVEGSLNREVQLVGKAMKATSDAAEEAAEKTEDAFETVPPAIEKVSERAKELQEKFKTLKAVMDPTTEGTIEYAEAVQGLQAIYADLEKYQDYYVENNMEVDASITELMASIEALGIVTKKTVKETVDYTKQVVGESKDFFVTLGEYLKALTVGIREDTVEEWKAIHAEVKGFLEGIFTSIGDMFGKNRQARADYEEGISGLRDKAVADEKAALDEREKALGELEEAYRDNRIEYEEYCREKDKITRDYNERLAGIRKDEEKGLGDLSKTYEKERVTVWEILKQGVRDFLKALRERFLLKAAAEAADAIILGALAAAALFFDWVQAAKWGAEAAAHGWAAAAYTVAGLSLAVAGFAKGAVALGPTLAMVGEGAYGEAVIPLSPPVLADIGAGIVAAMEGARYEAAPSPGGDLRGATIDIHVAEQATFYVREEADIKKVARALGEEFDDRAYDLGWVSA